MKLADRELNIFQYFFIVFFKNDKSGFLSFFKGVGTQIIITSTSLIFEKLLVAEKFF